jgi:predicted small lipoprotein YifL
MPPNPLLLIAMLLLALCLTACGPRHPLGIPDDQWEAMTMDQQLQARQQQADLDRAHAERRAEEARARTAEAEAKIAERERRRQEARYGDRVQCVLANGEARLGRSWDRIQPLAFDLVRGFEEEVQIEVASDRMRGFSAEAYAYFDGQTVYVCRMPFKDTYRQDDCARLTATSRELERGVERYVQGRDFLKGMMRCDLPPRGGHQGFVIERF